jgi:digeranylgeranylglycerophospholipid reductase
MATKYDHDVIVIGGGPAGSTFARVAAGAGMDVLVIDKRKEIGVPVRCGEGLGQSDIIGRDGIELPKACYSLEVEGTKICGPNGCSIEWKDKQTVGWVLERKVFDKWLCELAIEKGAQVSTYTRAIGVLKDEKGKPNGVKVTHGGREPYDIRAPLIVSAEGMESMMARQMGFKTVHSLYEVGTCYEYEMSPIDHENLIEIHLGTTVAPKGYVWVFPKADKKANVGIGIGGHIADSEKQSGIKGVAPKQVLDNFIQKRERYSKSSVLTEFGGVISIGAPINEFVKDNCMVIGTAAKQVDPIHGGGIHLAMNAGIIAAEVAVKAKAKNTYSREVLYEYEKTWRGTDGKICSDRLKLQKALEKLNDDDLNYIIGSITKNDVTAAMDGRFHDPVMKVVAGRPTLLKVLSALL